jgi:peptidoglycan/xylan/chitin deacetylase (PgdA/CDA1 family)
MLAVAIACGALTIPVAVYFWSAQAQAEHPAAQWRPPQLDRRLMNFVRSEQAPDYRGALVLTFHNVLPAGGNRYTLTPRRFDADVAALVRAGYHTITAAHFLAYVRGRREQLPAHAVLLSFDDGTKGDWIYVDPLLREYRLTAVLFAVTGLIGTHQPYYLNWTEVKRMAASGRWSIESHTRNGRELVATGPGSEEGAFLTNVAWDNASARLETESQWRDRISGDLRGSVDDLVGHGLPRPRLFAFPYSATNTPSNDPSIPPLLGEITSSLFAVTFQDSSYPHPVRLGKTIFLPRLRVLRSTDPATLLQRMKAAAARS